MSQAPKLTDELVSYLESGISILVATRDAALRPTANHAVGARVSADRHILTVFLVEPTAAKAIENARETRRMAVTFARAQDHRSIQIKGPVLEIRPTTEDERAFQRRYVELYAEHCEFVGLPRRLVLRKEYEPSVAIGLGIDDLFLQTPGPSAGTRLTSS